MDSSGAALFIVDIYQEYDKAVGLENGKNLFSIFYQNEKGKVTQWKFLEEHLEIISDFIRALIDLGIIQGRILGPVSEERSEDEE